MTEGGWEGLVVNKLFPKQSGNQERGHSSDIFQIVRSLTTYANKYNFIRQAKEIRLMGPSHGGWH